MTGAPRTRGARAGDDLDDGRDETADQRADRNWNELLQELRVLQTGTQIITGFLLALAFQPSFGELSPGQRSFYLVLIALSALSAVVALSPVALHRALFRHRAKPTVVMFGHIAMLTALATVALLLTGVVAFVFDIVVGAVAAWVAGGALVACIVGLWIVAPAVFRRRSRPEA